MIFEPRSSHFTFGSGCTVLGCLELSQARVKIRHTPVSFERVTERSGHLAQLEKRERSLLTKIVLASLEECY